MTYIINPLWFYLIDVMKELKFVSIVVATICSLASLAFKVCAIDTYHEEDKVPFNKMSKITFIVALIALIMWIIIPSKETMLTMMVAKFATYENAAWTLDTVKAAVDYIVNAIASIG